MNNKKEDQKLIWDHFQAGNKQAFLSALPRYNFLINQVKNKTKQASKVLNVGIGLGFIERQLLSEAFEVYSLDPSENIVKEQKKYGIKAEIGFIENQPFKDNFFDVIILSEVIEHIPLTKLNNAIEESYRVLKPGGYVFVTVPFNEILEENEVICPNCGDKFHRWGHYSSFDKNKLNLLFSTKFKVQKIKVLAFTEWKLDLYGLVKNITKFLLGKLGKAITSPRIYLLAKKQ